MWPSFQNQKSEAPTFAVWTALTCLNVMLLHNGRSSQETQLSLTNRATRLKVSQGHQTWYIPYVRYGYLLVCYSNFVRKTKFFVFDIFDFKNAVTLKTGLRVRTLKVMENVII